MAKQPTTKGAKAPAKKAPARKAPAKKTTRAAPAKATAKAAPAKRGGTRARAATKRAAAAKRAVTTKSASAPASAKLEVSDEIAIQIRQMHKWYGDFHVLKDINLTVQQGERIVICGPSGSGKSTMIRCINRLEEHDSGKIIVSGRELTSTVKDIDAVRSEVGMVFQSFNLFPHLTVIKNLMLALKLVRKMNKSQAREVAMRFLNRVRIPEQADKYPSQLSGGQQQRVAIARALCMNPQVMLFDEPTSALDPEMISEVLDVMIDLVNEGLTMICVTHEMGFARSVADSIVFMDYGEIVEMKPPDEFFGNPENERTKLFLSQIISH